jgi:SDR family mycofactocin-dependent oxidoreductase
MIDLSSRVALVTGAARGIGRATAVALAEAGADVVVTDLLGTVESTVYATASPTDLDETARLVRAAGRHCIPLAADVRSFEQLRAAVERATDELGRLDSVVANAGIASWGKSTWQLSERQWDDMIAVNLTGAWNTARAAIPALLAGGQGGAIVIVSSSAALKPLPTIGHYSAAKAGCVALARSLALELARERIRVNTVHPGGTSTYMTENPEAERWQATSGVADTLTLPIPIERMDPEDIAHAIRWLVSDEARHVTGVALPVDAGALLK